MMVKKSSSPFDSTDTKEELLTLCLQYSLASSQVFCLDPKGDSVL